MAIYYYYYYLATISTKNKNELEKAINEKRKDSTHLEAMTVINIYVSKKYIFSINKAKINRTA